MTHEQIDCEAQQMHHQRAELVERIARAIPADGTAQPLHGLHLNRVSSSTEPLHGVSTRPFV